MITTIYQTLLIIGAMVALTIAVCRQSLAPPELSQQTKECLQCHKKTDHGPYIDLDDRIAVRYPANICFDGKPLEPGEFT